MLIMFCKFADFLRLSRATTDDTITQNLNALLKPAKRGFDPSSTSERHTHSSSSRQIDKVSCKTFKEKVLFPSWQARSDVINYCGIVATSRDPEDPDILIREAEDAKSQDAVVDERLDPYSGRNFPRETRTKLLANTLRNEKGVEKIVRERSWALVNERCERSSLSAAIAFDNWRSGQKKSR